jgi:prepilin-type N-terminal cleavage/methylation domain-containing protein
VTSRIRRRTAFTLIELLVVVSIITVMMSLLMAGVQRARDAGSRTLAHSEIRELAQGVALFKNKFSVDYIPSRIVLHEDGAYGNTQVEIDTLNWLRTAWPNLNTQVDWNGDGAIATGAAGTFTLEGDQCLVFFLGGDLSGGQPDGFSTNPRNPMQKGGKRVGPFAQFQTIRLNQSLHGNVFACYIDPWKKVPYAYLASYGKQRGFSPYGSSDCPTLGVLPYLDPNSGKPLSNADGFGFQIISAGKDAAFGPGGANLPATGAGEDDIANFSRATLGSGIQ